MKHIFFLLFLFSNILYSSVVLNDDTQKYDNFKIMYFYDEDSKFTIDDISQHTFKKTIPNQFTQGYKSGTAWFKIELENKSSVQDYVIYFTEPFWSKLDMYVQENSIWKIQENGLDIPLKLRTIQDNSPAYKLKIAKDEQKVLYLRGKTLSGHIGEIQIFTDEEYYNPSRTTITEFYIIYAFILFGMVIINVYNLIVTHDKIYAFYIYYILSVIVFIGMKSACYLSFEFQGWNEGLHVVGATMLYFLLLFSREFLKLKERMPKMEVLFNIFAALFLIFAVLIQFNIPYASLVFNITSSIFMAILFATAIRLLIKGHLSIKYYLLALAIYAITMALMTSNFNQILPNTDITRYSFLFGLFAEILFFTLILTNRFVEANKQRVKAQNDLLSEKHNNEVKLKAEINKQTKNLSEANAKLQEQKKELETVQERLKQEATTDVLSGLYNRRYFFELADKCFYSATRYSQDLSIILIDIDHFKKINDTYGHIYGDKVIKFVSNIFSQLVRHSDTAARYGGEEFVVIMPQTNKEEAFQLAQRIRVAVEQEAKDEFKIDTPITISVGVTQSQSTDLDIEKTLIRCDSALYQAKAKGRNLVVSL